MSNIPISGTFKLFGAVDFNLRNRAVSLRGRLLHRIASLYNHLVQNYMSHKQLRPAP
jgi:hypothetical protein